MLIAVITVLTFACRGEEEASAPTAMPLSTPAATPAGESGELEGFRAFARQIEAAILAKDSQFFVERAVLQELTCGADEQLAPCAGQPSGATLTGVPGGVFQSDASNLFTPEEYAQALDRYFAAAFTDESDQYGGGSLALYALARSVADDGTVVFQAITTSIVNTYPTGYPIGTKEREAHVFRFSFTGGRWRFTGEGVAVNSISSSEWLSGQCAECYDSWERWPAGALADDPAAAATTVASAGGFPTPQEAIEAYGEAWLPPFLGDCDALEQPEGGSCLAADRTVEEAAATYRLCRPGVDACLLVNLARNGAGVWTIASVTAYGGPSEQQLVP